MSKFLLALLLGLSILATTTGGTAVAVQSDSIAVTGLGANGSGALTISGPTGTGYCVHAFQANGSYARQASGLIPGSGSVTVSVSASVPGSDNIPMFYVGYGSGGGMTWLSLTPVGDDDGWWLW